VRSLWVLAILAIALVLGWNSGFSLLFRVSLLLAIGLVLSRLWVWWNLRGVKGNIETSTTRVQAGQRLEVRIELENPSLLFKPWLLLKIKSDLPQVPPTKMLALSYRSARTFSFFIPCPRRGWFHLGPTVLASQDPFGLFQREITLGTQQDLLVYPKTVGLAPSLLETPTPGPESLSLGRAGEIPLVRGVREYLPGDSFSRIHWPSSAHMGKLMSKELEGETSHDVWLLLDMEGRGHAGESDESTVEYGVTVAASLCKAYVEADRSIALATWDRYLQVVPPDTGTAQLWRILEVLSTLSGRGNAPLSRLMSQSEQHWRGSTLAIITPSPEETWSSALHKPITWDNRVILFLLDASTFDKKKPPPGPSPAHDQITRYRVRRGELWQLGLAAG
jgi:uncharacterized protein (DUF58 family)